MSFDASPQWLKGRFRNPQEWPRRTGLRGFLRWQLAGRPGPRPANFAPPTLDNDGARLRAEREQPSVTWIGHATLLVQSNGVSVLTDPIFSERISGFVRRLAPPGITVERLPPLDLVVISHNHRDHLDEPSVLALGKQTQFAVPLGLAAWFKNRGFERVLELDWWQTEEFAPGARVTLVPAQHWSQRSVSDTNLSLWGGFVIEMRGAKYYFAGDTGYPAAFPEIGRRCPGIDYALLPIGAYEPRWFMQPQHMSPIEAAKAFGELGARFLVPMHWGTFRLTDEPLDEPPRLLHEAMPDDSERILQLRIGETHWG
ncbi:MAG TPA: MBL fold metallo-hydrolase [Polyangiaceae bacterium]|nr:MBL fold metallo-hydrolase [Polyangiaceae bacterium]